jgi:hypothetical protein
MSALSLACSITAMAPGLTTSFQAQGGIFPYTYSVDSGGAGGSINSSTGIYTAPSLMNSDPKKGSDIVRVTDGAAQTASLPILVTNPLGLFCEVIQREMNLASGRVYLWDQKINQPTDSGLYIAVGVLTCKPFANTTAMDGSGSGLDAIQSVNMLATLSIDAISRGPEARDRKEEIILALNSIYAQSQQELNSFYIGKLPAGGQFVNLSNIDGAAIPYRFNLSINVQYVYRKIKAAPYFDDFSIPTVTTET